MDGSPGVAVAVPCLVLSSAGVPPVPTGKVRPEAGGALEGALSGSTPLAIVKPDTGEVAVINTRADDAMPFGSASSQVLGEGPDGPRLAYVRTQNGDAAPILINAELGGVGEKANLESPASMLCAGRAAGDVCGPQGAAGAYARGCGDESERLAQYSETLAQLMQPEAWPNDSSTSENTNQDGGSSAGDQGREHDASVELGTSWFCQPGDEQAAAGTLQGPHGVHYILGRLAKRPNGVHGDLQEEMYVQAGGVHAQAVAGGAIVRVPCRTPCDGLKAQRVEPVVPVFNDSAEGQFAGAFPLDSEKRIKVQGGDAAAAAAASYYVACQQMKKPHPEEQQQQQQLALLWQAYLSGLYNGYGLASGPGSGQTLPQPPPAMPAMHSTSLPRGWMLNANAVGGIQEIQENEGDERMEELDYSGQKRSRVDAEPHGVKLRVSKKGRKRAEDRVCSNCTTRATPFWRKDRHTGKPLCNACGLYFSKNDVPRPVSLWRNAGGSGEA
ncbi:unnamed protein product [Ostreobium quekettii]|uniref:GATA-type domain-containing protein n=1 Tax=Ostreobium quekettii TaxID=121088 RepID=A0A8S1JAZ4_9CHLO|nr:unnamed protein product [Ostreobium quekettii]|eukprot:evm.model.scf_256EXC.2 EVM.evm.TU.scf_256EXC.2   scf_256EXC:11329-13979(-)